MKKKKKKKKEIERGERKKTKKKKKKEDAQKIEEEEEDRDCEEGTWAVPGGDYGNAGRRFGAVKIIRWCPSTATGPVYLRSLCAAIFGTAARQVFPPGPTSNYQGGRSKGLKGS
uniref:Uncharacterized protein n=1 Tax=Vespula pensylvanica TaxID=30213 RepID=A0A834NDT9_VESPE|nr:hypothetical protein H0235_015113 [Vespula pensylvanica]